MTKKESEIKFWAESIAEKIAQREKFYFTNNKTPKLKKWTVKCSSSVSGVLHIGRLSDIIRGEAVYRALNEIGFPAELIYVTEDMDPLRSIPKGVPESFTQYIGFSVSDVPDPEKCHKSYSDHFKSIFLSTFEKFLQVNLKVYSMREEYKKGTFNEAISAIINKIDIVREIINKTRETPLSQEWSPWKPICNNCGNLQTTVVTKAEGTNIEYSCKDYSFEKYTAKGCNYSGTTDISKANGKLAWKSEWASQWKVWQSCSEGAGKEYNAPNSAFFINGEICEKVLNFPMPEPIFYEHLLIDNKKMSASLGNVIYPHNWLEVMRPETLKYLYMKKLAKTRSFSWADAPKLESEFDGIILAASSSQTSEDDKELINKKSLYKYSSVKNRKLIPLDVDYQTISYLLQLFLKSQIISKLKSLNLIKNTLSSEAQFQLEERILHVSKWLEKYAPESEKLQFLETISEDIIQQIPLDIKPYLSEIPSKLPSLNSPEDIQSLIFNTAKNNNIPPNKLFKAIYLLITGKTSGPKAGTLILAIGKDKIISRLKEFCNN